MSENFDQISSGSVVIVNRHPKLEGKEGIVTETYLIKSFYPAILECKVKIDGSIYQIPAKRLTLKN